MKQNDSNATRLGEQEPTLERLKSGVEKTRAGLVTRLEDSLAGRIDADLLDELEYTLVSADIGIKTTTEILERIRQQVDRRWWVMPRNYVA